MISSDQYLTYYQGAVNNVSVIALDGRRIQFPANLLRKHITHNGVQGVFEIEFDEHNKLVELYKIL